MSSSKHNLSLANIITQFIIGGTIVATVTTLATKFSPLAASIVTAFPIGLIPMFFIHNRSILTKYGYDTTITNTLVVISYLAFDMLIRHHVTYPYAPIITILVWCILALSTYLVLTR